MDAQVGTSVAVPEETLGRFRTRLTAAVAAVPLFAGALPAHADEVPAPLQVAILVKVLVYDRTLAMRSRDGLKLAVIYDPSSDASKSSRDQFVRAFNETPRVIGGKQIELVEMAQEKLESSAESVDIVYVAGGTDVGRVVDLAKKHQLITFASDRDAVEDGVVLGLVPRGDKPKLLINVGASVASGMELDPQVLRLAELVRGSR